MHESGLHVYDPREHEQFTFVNTEEYTELENGHFTLLNTVSENKVDFIKRQIKRAERARALYATLSCPSMTDFSR
jgi:hypothetical protein